ncbi:MAG: ABC transporter permease [Treponema sp.]|nr:ABC transporter permease [Treponema sp.]
MHSLRWVLFVSRRFSRVDRKGRSAVTSFLASLGICFGVMTLITVISVMNGFQRSFIDAIMEVSSYHIRLHNLEGALPDGEPVSRADVLQYCLSDRDVTSVHPFYEAQALVNGRDGAESAALIRAVPQNQLSLDAGFAKELHVYSGVFDVSEPNTIVLGSDLAYNLHVRVGSTVNLYALSGGNDVELLSSDRTFRVTGLFYTGYNDINASYAFISLSDGEKYFGEDAVMYFGVKLASPSADSRVISRLEKAYPFVQAESYKSYNRSFFGALRVEKNMLMLLVFLIFVVVGINIFNGMRRMVYERREEISVLSAFGARRDATQLIFIMQGFLIGVLGAVPGLVLGLLLSVQMSTVFSLMSRIVYWVQVFVAMLISPETAMYVRENPMYMIYAHIPPRIFPGEVLVITVFGIFSALLASWLSSRSVLTMTVAEVLRDE